MSIVGNLKREVELSVKLINTEEDNQKIFSSSKVKFYDSTVQT